MNGDPKQATSATTALVYVTAGALIDVWTTVYFFYIRKAGAGDATYLWISGFFFTGLVLMMIGLALGRIARAVSPAEVAPVPTTVVTPAAALSPPVAQMVEATNRPRTARTEPAVPLQAVPAVGLPTRDRSDFLPLPPE